MTNRQTVTNVEPSANRRPERDSSMTRRAPVLLKHTSLLCVVGSGLLLLAGCGSGSSSMPTAPSAAQPPQPAAVPTPPPPPSPLPTPVTNEIGRGSSSVPSKVLLAVPFTTTATGTVGVTVDWTLSANNIDTYLARGTFPCTLEQFNDNQCPFVGFSTSASAKPERLSVPNLPAGPYTLFIANFGSSDESLSYEITLASVPGASASSAPGTRFGDSNASVSRIIKAD